MMPSGPGGRLVQHELLLLGILQQRNRLLHHVPPPEVAGGGLHLQRRVAAYPKREREPGVERELGQRALAEAVDGGDGGAVEVADGARQPRFGVADSGAPPVRRQLARLAAANGRVSADGVARRVQGLPDAGAQFAGGGDREGDDQQLFDAVACFDHQARGERGQRVRLAGPGAGLDQQSAIQRRGDAVSVRPCS